MSIIQEALKKAQGTYVRTVSRSQAEVAKPYHPASNMPMLIPAVIVLTIVIGFGLKIFLTDASNARIKESNGSHQDNAGTITAKGQAMDAITTSIKNSIPTAFIAGQAPNLTLNGVMYLKESPRAIINGNMVQEGDSVNGARVTAINKDNVRLDYNNAEITLKLK